jgi:hypothetical protein
MNKTPNDRAEAKSGRQRNSQITKTVLLLRQGRLDHDAAIDKVINTSPEGNLLAGRLALDMAYQAENKEGAQASFGRAERLFGHALKSVRRAGGKDNHPVAAHAKLHLAHLPIDTSMVIDRKLPKRSVARKAYAQTIHIGYGLMQADKVGEQAKGDTSRLGLLGEVAVLSLLERFSIFEIGPEEWSPFMARWSQDMSHNPRHGKKDGWDIGVMTNITDDPKLAYRVQVKTGTGVRRDYSYEAGIAEVHVYPDLQLESDPDPRVAGRIITECADELAGFSGGTRDLAVSRRLNDRLDRVLDMMDAA